MAPSFVEPIVFYALSALLVLGALAVVFLPRIIHAALMSAYWAEGRDVGDVDVLVELVEPLGLDPDQVRAVVEEGRYEDLIGASTTAVLEMGAGGVPAFVVDDRLLIPGAQPHELFDRVLQKLGYVAGGH